MKFNPKRDLPYLAAIAQSVLYAWAGVSLLGAWGVIVGLCMGLLVSVTMAYASSQYDTTAKSRQPFVMSGMIVLGVISPIVIGTSMFLDLPAVIHPIWRGIVGAVMGVIPDVSVFLTGFVAGKGLVRQDEKTQGTQETKPARVEKPQTWQDKPYRCEVCKVGYDKQTSLAAHMGHATAHKSQKPVSYAVGKDELVPLVKTYARGEK